MLTNIHDIWQNTP